MAVIGVDLAAMAQAVVKHWGLDETALEMMQPLPPQQSVHVPTAVDGWMRLVASCANETLAASRLQSPASGRALVQVCNRYAKALGATPEILNQALLAAHQKLGRHLRPSPGAASRSKKGEAPE